jgi:3-hydroxybutyryl-CoA dehydrogenase/5-formyl-3-hydroxy-2-methylpyridine 4-carboxylate dehydrogenase
MGPGMGAVLARAGIQVALYDVSADALERAKGGLEIAKGVLDRLDAPAADGGGVSFESDLATALDGTQVVAEAVPEQLELKKQVIADVEQHVSDDAIIASNTSGIPITKMAEGMKKPDRLVGWHWSNPPTLIPMNEVIAGEQTSAEAVSRSRGSPAGSATTP